MVSDDANSNQEVILYKQCGTIYWNCSERNWEEWGRKILIHSFKHTLWYLISVYMYTHTY